MNDSLLQNTRISTALWSLEASLGSTWPGKIEGPGDLRWCFFDYITINHPVNWGAPWPHTHMVLRVGNLHTDWSLIQAIWMCKQKPMGGAQQLGGGKGGWFPLELGSELVDWWDPHSVLSNNIPLSLVSLPIVRYMMLRFYIMLCIQACLMLVTQYLRTTYIISYHYDCSNFFLLLLNW